MTIYKDSSIFLGVVVLLVSNLFADTPALQYSLNPAQVEPGQRAVLEIRLDTRALTEFDGDVDSIDVGDSLLNSLEPLSLLGQEKRFEAPTAIWRYEFTAYDNGNYTLPPIEFSYGASSFSSESLSLTVNSSRAAEDMALREGFGETEVPWIFPKWLGTLLIILGMTAVLTPIIWRLLQRYWPKKRLLKAVTVQIETPRESDRDWLLRHLKEYRSAMEARPSDPKLIDELTQILRTYYARKLEYPVTSLTTHEFSRRFSTVDTGIPTIVSVFKQCDAVKFTNEPFKPYDLAAECLQTVEQTLCT